MRHLSGLSVKALGAFGERSDPADRLEVPRQESRGGTEASDRGEPGAPWRAGAVRHILERHGGSRWLNQALIPTGDKDT